jgi:hypothetical protein
VRLFGRGKFIFWKLENSDGNLRAQRKAFVGLQLMIGQQLKGAGHQSGPVSNRGFNFPRLPPYRDAGVHERGADVDGDGVNHDAAGDDGAEQPVARFVAAQVEVASKFTTSFFTS